MRDPNIQHLSSGPSTFSLTSRLAVVLSLVGCDNAPRAPVVEPPDVSVIKDEAVITLGAVIPKTGCLEGTMWEQVLRQEASRQRILIEVERTESGAQADAVLGLLKRGISALLVVADPADAALPATLLEARRNGVPVVLLDQPVAVEGEPFPLVRMQPIEDAAKMLVEAALEDALEAGFPSNGPAMVVINGPFDAKGTRRIAAIKAALKAAQIDILPDIEFAGYMTEAGTAIRLAVDQNPDVAMLIADEDQGARSAATVRDNLDPKKRRFVVAAFGSSPELRKLAGFNVLAAVVDRQVVREAVTALDLAIDLARGKPAPTRHEILVPPRFLRRSGPEIFGMAPRPMPKASPSDSPNVPLRGFDQ